MLFECHRSKCSNYASLVESYWKVICTCHPACSSDEAQSHVVVVSSKDSAGFCLTADGKLWPYTNKRTIGKPKKSTSHSSTTDTCTNVPGSMFPSSGKNRGMCRTCFGRLMLCEFGRLLLFWERKRGGASTRALHRGLMLHRMDGKRNLPACKYT